MNKLSPGRSCLPFIFLLIAFYLPSNGMAATATQVFDLEGFDKIRVLAPFKLEATQGSDFLIEVTVDQKYSDVIKVTRKNSTLVLSVEPGNYNFSTLDAHVTLPALKSIEVIGASRATLSGFDQHALAVDIVGVGRVEGTSMWIDQLDLRVIGTGAGGFQ